MDASQTLTKIHLTTPRFVVRTVEQDDVTLRWAAWMADPAMVKHLNTKPLTLDIEDLRGYVASFDHVSSHILGIFEHGSGTMIGFWEVYVDWKHKEFMLNVLIGEDRGKRDGLSPRRESQRVIVPHFFETLGLETARFSMISTNEPMRHIMDSRGVAHEHVSQKPSATGGGPVDIMHYRVTKAEWLALRAARLELEGRAAAKAAG
jgi:RimJ/RimL family protein N-acetyltransferase